MVVVQSLVLYIVKSMGLILVDPIFLVLAITVIYLYKREIRKIQKEINEKAYIGQIIKNIGVGTCIGVVISGCLELFGLQFHVTPSILILLPLAVVLMMIAPKYGCFSYVIAIAYIIEGVLSLAQLAFYTLNYGELVVLVGALHILEGVLILIMGDQLSIKEPIYEDGKLVTAHLLRQLWMVPIIVLSNNVPVPLYTVLAYGDITTKPKEQKYITGALISLFGIIVLGLGVMSIKEILPIGGVIILVPVLHELTLILSHAKKPKRRHCTY